MKRFKLDHLIKATVSTKLFVLSMVMILLLGLGAIFYLYQILNPSLADYLSTGNPVTRVPISLTLSLSSPDDNLFTAESDLLIAGKTIPAALVLISRDETDQMIQSDSSGNFSQTLSLSEGVNHISVVAFDNLGNSKSADRTIFYSKEKI